MENSILKFWEEKNDFQIFTSFAYINNKHVTLINLKVATLVKDKLDTFPGEFFCYRSS